MIFLQLLLNTLVFSPQLHKNLSNGVFELCQFNEFSILLWQYLLVEEEELFYWSKVSRFLLAALFANARRVDAIKFRVRNKTIYKTTFLFSKIEGFLLEQFTFDYLST